MKEPAGGTSTCCTTCRHFPRALASVAYNATVKQGHLLDLPCPARCSPCTGKHDRSGCADGKACNPCKGWRK